MTTRGTSRLTAACLLAALIIGCTPEEPEEPDGGGTVETPTDPQEPEEPEDPYAIPDEIDTDYLDRVFEALNEVDLELRNEVLRAGAFTDAADVLLEKLYVGLALEDERGVWTKTMESGGQLEQYAGGPLITSTERIADSTDTCVVAVTTQDRSELLRDPPPPTRTYTILIVNRQEESLLPNPTPWRIGARVRLNDDSDDHMEEGMCQRFVELLQEA